MKLLKFLGVLVTLVGVGILVLVFTLSVYGPFASTLFAQGRPLSLTQSGQTQSGQTRSGQTQSRQAQSGPDERSGSRSRDLMMLAGRGAEIGVRIAEGSTGGVVVEEVQPDSPAEKAGLKRSDIIVEFDGERVRSARQFGRLVQETPPGRTVKASVMRDGQKKDLQITPSEGRGMGLTMDAGHLRDRLGDLGNLGQLWQPFNFNFDFDMSGALSGRRLGVTVDELTRQLADYFGTKDGVLVTAVTDGSVAARAGLKAGDVIATINGSRVTSRDDLVRAVRDANEGDMTIGIVREKKESSLKAKMDPPTRRTFRGARPV